MKQAPANKVNDPITDRASPTRLYKYQQLYLKHWNLDLTQFECLIVNLYMCMAVEDAIIDMHLYM